MKGERGGEGEGCGADVQMSERLIRCGVFACVVIDMYDRMARLPFRRRKVEDTLP